MWTAVSSFVAWLLDLFYLPFTFAAMHLNSAVAAALLAGGAQAHGFHGNPHGFVGQDHIPGAPPAGSSTASVSYTVPAELPTFTVSLSRLQLPSSACRR